MNILCAGDSHVEGVGASIGLDYCSQLGRLLNHEYGGRFCSVVNLGHAGFNSSQTASEAIDYLESGRVLPDLLVFQAGVNNNHNYVQAPELFDSVQGPGVWSLAKYSFSDIRVFHALLILIDRIRYVGESSEDREVEAASTRFQPGNKNIRFVQSWIQRDLESLHEATSKAGVKLMLVNYWHPAKWIEEVFTDFASKYSDVLFCNAGNYGSNMSMLTAYRIYSNPDFHPNKYGYALIAELIQQDLMEAGWLAPNQFRDELGSTDETISDEPDYRMHPQ